MEIDILRVFQSESRRQWAALEPSVAAIVIPQHHWRILVGQWLKEEVPLKVALRHQ